MLTVQEVAGILAVHESTVVRWCKLGRIACIKLPNGHWRIRQEVLDDILRGYVPQHVAAQEVD